MTTGGDMTFFVSVQVRSVFSSMAPCGSLEPLVGLILGDFASLDGLPQFVTWQVVEVDLADGCV